MRQDIGGKATEDISDDGKVSADHYIWHPVTRAVENVKNQGPEWKVPGNVSLSGKSSMIYEITS
jgi:hypothetical protein